MRNVVSIVDDDAAVRQALDTLLRSVGVLAVTFASAEEFLDSDCLATTGCLILDLWMPGMGGLMLQRRLARDGHRIPIIVLTAHGGAEVREQTLGAGAVAFLRKPCDADVLVATVTSILRTRTGTAGIGGGIPMDS
jgi:FixJ family two-component response regulator